MFILNKRTKRIELHNSFKDIRDKVSYRKSLLEDDLDIYNKLEEEGNTNLEKSNTIVDELIMIDFFEAGIEKYEEILLNKLWLSKELVWEIEEFVFNINNEIK